MLKNRWTLMDYLRIGFGGFPSAGLVGIDTTHQCNLKCRHCYFRRQPHESELSPSAWRARLETLKAEGLPLHICGWLGGEPLLRPEVIEAGKDYFKSNVIFTNGTVEFPPWRDCKFVVSIPGTRRAYCELTGVGEKNYDMLKEHVDRPDLDIAISFCITRQNVDCIVPFLEEWGEQTAVKGVFFEFYTPSRGEGGQMWLDWAERDRVLDSLIHLKRTYGTFIYNTFQMLDLMKSPILTRILSNCPFGRIGLSLDSMGKRKLPCTLGPQADCSRCGCILPVFSLLLSQRMHLVRAFADGVVKTIGALRKGAGAPGSKSRAGTAEGTFVNK